MSIFVGFFFRSGRTREGGDERPSGVMRAVRGLMYSGMLLCELSTVNTAECHAEISRTSSESSDISQIFTAYCTTESPEQ